MNKEILNKLDDANVRIGQIIYLAGALSAMDACPDNLKEFVEDEFDTFKKLFELPDYIDEFDTDSVMYFLQENQKLGFIVKIETPIIESGKWSWGYFTYEYVYAETLNEAIDKGVLWAKSTQRSD